MNPTHLLAEILKAAKAVHLGDRSASNIGMLALGILHLDEHLLTGGAPPEQWTAEGTSVGTALGSALDGMSELAAQVRALKSSTP